MECLGLAAGKGVKGKRGWKKPIACKGGPAISRLSNNRTAKGHHYIQEKFVSISGNAKEIKKYMLRARCGSAYNNALHKMKQHLPPTLVLSVSVVAFVTPQIDRGPPDYRKECIAGGRPLI